jgi:streptomycin 6-kinase
VAIDLAPCLGDPAFDAVDLICGQAEDVETIEARTERLAAATSTHAARLLGWCTAFAGMIPWNSRAKETAPARRLRRSWGSLPRRQRTSGSQRVAW